MRAFATDTVKQDYSSLAPIMLCATSDQAMGRAAWGARSSGLRIGPKVRIEEALRRLSDQGALEACWVELDRDLGPPMYEVLRKVNALVRDGRCAAVVSLTAPLLDCVVAHVEEQGVELIVDADDAARATALGLARAWHRRPLQVSDAGRDRSAERLRQLGDEVSRIAATLARLSSTSPAAAPGGLIPRPDLPELSVSEIRRVIQARRLRARYFPEDLFADPAWDMMLDLLQAEIAQLRVAVSSLCIAASVPSTTALRWLKTLVGQGLFLRRSDPHDGRRVFVELAPETSRSLRQYFAEVGSLAVI